MIGKSMPDFKELDLSVVPQPNFQEPTGFTLEQKQAIVKVLMLYGIPVTVDGKCDYQDLKVRANEMLQTPIDQSKNMTMIERFVHRLRMLAIQFDRIKSNNRQEENLVNDDDKNGKQQDKRLDRIQVIELSDDQQEQNLLKRQRKVQNLRNKRLATSFYSGQQDDQPDDEERKIMPLKYAEQDLNDSDNDDDLGKNLNSLTKSKKSFDPDNDGFTLSQKQIQALNRNIPMLQFIRRKILTQNCKLFNAKIKQIDLQFKTGTDYCKKFKVPWNKILHHQWQPSVHDLILLQAIAKHGMNFCEEFDSILLAQHNFDDQILFLLDPDIIQMRVEYVFEKIKIASSSVANQGGSNNQNLGSVTSPSVRKQGSEQINPSGYKKDRNISTGFIPSRKPKKEFKVNRDQAGNIIYPIIVNASLKIQNLGVVDYQRKAYHSERNIFPIGFRSIREHQSILQKGQRANYLCQIQDGGDKPQFKITPSQDPDNPIINQSSTGCWVRRFQYFQSILIDLNLQEDKYIKWKQPSLSNDQRPRKIWNCRFQCDQIVTGPAKCEQMQEISVKMRSYRFFVLKYPKSSLLYYGFYRIDYQSVSLLRKSLSDLWTQYAIYQSYQGQLNFLFWKKIAYLEHLLLIQTNLMKLYDN